MAKAPGEEAATPAAGTPGGPAELLKASQRALARIGQQLPSATLSRLLLAGERIEGRDAVAAGLATHRAADGDAVTQALGLAARFSSLPAGAVETTKRFICALSASSLDPAVWQHERMALLSSHARRVAIGRAQNRPGT